LPYWLNQLTEEGEMKKKCNNKMVLLFSFVIMMVPLTFAKTSLASPVLYGFIPSEGLFSIDPSSGTVTLVLSSTRRVEGLAFDSNTGTLYGIENLTGDNLLVEIDPESGTISDIGFVTGYTEITAMTFDPMTGKAFALDQQTTTLLEIDLSTGAGASIGGFGFAAANALAAHPTTGNLFAGVGVAPGSLAEIDKTTGNGSLIGSTGTNVVAGLAFHPETGELYGAAQITGGGCLLVTIDTLTGTATVIGETGGFCIASIAFSEPILLSVDIKPGSCPNPLNLKSKGALPVSVLGTEEFDVTTVDPATVTIQREGVDEHVAPLRWAYEDVATPFEPFLGKEDCYEDCNELWDDGYTDLTLKFDSQEIVAAIGEVSDEECLVLKLNGNLLEDEGGTPIGGEDVVLILK
jgi:hypothetical protein